jgi:hypothetical protein
MPTALSLARTRVQVSRVAIAGAATVVVLLAVVLGRAQQVQYAEQHYVNPDPFLGEGGPKKAYEFTQKLQDQRIGIIGSSQIIFGQYGFYGNDASNHVEYIGVKGPHGANRLPTTCEQLRSLVNEGEYDYVVASQFTQDTGPYNAGIRNKRAGSCRPHRRQIAGSIQARPAASACSRISSAERCGCSHQNMWPTSSRTSKRAFGISEAICSPLEKGRTPSTVPWTISVGAAISPRRPLVSWPKIACACSSITCLAAGTFVAISWKAA